MVLVPPEYDGAHGSFLGGPAGFGLGQAPVKPEEPAKYIRELPKLAHTDLSRSAVVCGNWLAPNVLSPFEPASSG